MDMDVFSCSEEKMNLLDLKESLEKNIALEAQSLFGLNNKKWFKSVTENWFNDNINYDGRWQVIFDLRALKAFKILDMAAGCGTFVLYGLHSNYDVWGIEPEEWKRQYYQKKIKISDYPEKFLSHMIGGVGENLPFKDESFDIVTTYQTLEHVKDVEKCIGELLRVLKPDGNLYLRAPDYNCFFEPHYRLPFLPRMNKKIAGIYLKFLGKPTEGLESLNWTTQEIILGILKKCSCPFKILDLQQYTFQKRRSLIEEKLPKFCLMSWLVDFLNLTYEYVIKKFIKFIRIFNEENQINLWITKGE